VDKDQTGKPGKKRTGGRSARVRESVLAAVLELTKTKNFTELSISEIAERARVHETTIYRRWGDKEGLIVEALLAKADEAIPEPNSGTIRGDMIAMLEDFIAFASSDTGISLLHAVASVGANAQELKQRYWQKRKSVLDRVIDRARARGELGPACDGTLLVEAMISPFYFRLLVSGAPIEADFPGRIVDAVLGGWKG